jgi:hypothetical protein
MALSWRVNSTVPPVHSGSSSLAPCTAPSSDTFQAAAAEEEEVEEVESEEESAPPIDMRKTNDVGDG